MGACLKYLWQAKFVFDLSESQWHESFHGDGQKDKAGSGKGNVKALKRPDEAKGLPLMHLHRGSRTSDVRLECTPSNRVTNHFGHVHARGDRKAAGQHDHAALCQDSYGHGFLDLAVVESPQLLESRGLCEHTRHVINNKRQQERVNFTHESTALA